MNLMIVIAVATAFMAGACGGMATMSFGISRAWRSIAPAHSAYGRMLAGHGVVITAALAAISGAALYQALTQ